MATEDAGAAASSGLSPPPPPPAEGAGTSTGAELDRAIAAAVAEAGAYAEGESDDDSDDGEVNTSLTAALRWSLITAARNNGHAMEEVPGLVSRVCNARATDQRQRWIDTLSRLPPEVRAHFAPEALAVPAAPPLGYTDDAALGMLSEALSDAAEAGRLDVVSALLTLGAPLLIHRRGAGSEGSVNVLHNVACGGVRDEQVAAVILSHPDVDAAAAVLVKDSDSWVPLHCTGSQDCGRMARVLLQSRAYGPPCKFSDEAKALIAQNVVDGLRPIGAFDLGGVDLYAGADSAAAAAVAAGAGAGDGLGAGTGAATGDGAGAATSDAATGPTGQARGRATRDDPLGFLHMQATILASLFECTCTACHSPHQAAGHHGVAAPATALAAEVAKCTCKDDGNLAIIAGQVLSLTHSAHAYPLLICAMYGGKSTVPVLLDPEVVPWPQLRHAQVMATRIRPLYRAPDAACAGALHWASRGYNSRLARLMLRACGFRDDNPEHMSPDTPVPLALVAALLAQDSQSQSPMWWSMRGTPFSTTTSDAGKSLSALLLRADPHARAEEERPAARKRGASRAAPEYPPAVVDGPDITGAAARAAEHALSPAPRLSTEQATAGAVWLKPSAQWSRARLVATQVMSQRPLDTATGDKDPTVPGSTVLHCAVRVGSAYAVRALLAWGGIGALAVRDADGSLPVDVALTYTRTEATAGTGVTREERLHVADVVTSAAALWFAALVQQRARSERAHARRALQAAAVNGGASSDAAGAAATDAATDTASRTRPSRTVTPLGVIASLPSHLMEHVVEMCLP